MESRKRSEDDSIEELIKTFERYRTSEQYTDALDKALLGYERRKQLRVTELAVDDAWENNR